jgi:hypothetical protein
VAEELMKEDADEERAEVRLLWDRIWETAGRASEEVSKWPWWKRGDRASEEEPPPVPTAETDGEAGGRRG